MLIPSCLDGRLLGDLGTSRCRTLSIAKEVFDLIGDPVGKNAEHASIRCKALAFLPEHVSHVLSCKLENVENKNAEYDDIQQSACDCEQLTRDVFLVALGFEHGSCQRCRHRHEKRRQFHSIEIFEVFAEWSRQNLSHDGKHDDVRDAGDRQSAVEQVGAEHKKGDGGLPRDDDDFPVSTSIHSVGAIKEARRLIRPAALVGEVLEWRIDRDDEKKKQPAVHWTHKCNDHSVKEFLVVSFIALHACVDSPV